MKPRLWHLSYDIANNRRLRQVANLAMRNGDRIQKSLYVCALSPEQLQLLHLHLADTLMPEDRLMLRPVCRKCRSRIRFQGEGGHPERHEPFWIV